LVFVLTFGVVAWPASSIRTGPSGSGWWETQEARTLRQAARTPTLTGDCAESERIYHLAAQACFLDGVADAHLSCLDNPGARGASRLDYRETPSRLQAEDSKLLQDQGDVGAAIERLKLRLTEMGVQTGLVSPVINAENFRSRDSLSLFRNRLRNSEVLLSFGLGESQSFLWAVTRNSLQVYPLPLAEQIHGRAREFRQAAEAGADGVDQGGRNYILLFGQLGAQEASTPAWPLPPLRSHDDALPELSIAAMVPGHFAERHTLQGFIEALAPTPQVQKIHLDGPYSGTAQAAPASWAAYQFFNNWGSGSDAP
jgi:hypothetical protein